jgi:hypothetical protein
MPAPKALTANLLSQLIGVKPNATAGSFPKSFDDLLTDTIASYRSSGGVVIDDQGNRAVSAAALWADYVVRRQEWQATFPERVDRYFENYAKNFWMREWYTTSVDLLAHSRRLLVRVAVLRLLLFSHPSLLAARSLTDVTAKRAALDRAAVEVFYRFSRAVEHQSNLLDKIAGAMAHEGPQTFAHTTFLALV